MDSKAVLKENKAGENFYNDPALSDFPWGGAVSTGENCMSVLEEDKIKVPPSKGDAQSPDLVEAIWERKSR